VNQSVAGWAAVFLASGFWLKRLLANQTFFGFQRSRHSGNRPSDVSSPFVIDITTLLTAKNVALRLWLEHLTAFNTWPWLNDWGFFVMLVVATTAAEPLILASGHKDFAATFTGNLDFRLSMLCSVSCRIV